jgi:nucleoside-diphosphate-sugar epimerase
MSASELVREDCKQSLQGRADQLAALKGETLVVTGGTGFVGTWIAEMVAALNDLHGFKTRTVLVSRSTDLFKSARPHLASRMDLKLIKSDVRHLMEVPRETTYLVHAAATPDTRFHANNPIETMTSIADGTAAVLRTTDRCAQFKMFLNLSSALALGTQPPELERLPETHLGAPNAGSVSSAYAEAKRYAETLCMAVRSQARLPVITARPFTFIGPYQKADSPWAANTFIADALAGGPIRVSGDGSTVRSYLYGADVAFWILKMLVSGQSGSTYNLGSSDAVTLGELAERVSRNFSQRPQIQLKAGMIPGNPATASQPGRSSRLVADTTLVSRELGLSPVFGLDQALARTIEWNRKSTERTTQ